MKIIDFRYRNIFRNKNKYRPALEDRKHKIENELVGQKMILKDYLHKMGYKWSEEQEAYYIPNFDGSITKAPSLFIPLKSLIGAGVSHDTEVKVARGGKFFKVIDD